MSAAGAADPDRRRQLYEGLLDSIEELSRCAASCGPPGGCCDSSACSNNGARPASECQHPANEAVYTRPDNPSSSISLMLRDQTGQSAEQMRGRHTNLE